MPAAFHPVHYCLTPSPTGFSILTRLTTLPFTIADAAGPQ